MWKRILLSTILGFLAGVFCFSMYAQNPQADTSAGMMWAVVINRALIGFAIGISVNKLNPLLNGILMGAVVGLGMSVPAYFGGGAKAFLITWIASIVWGLLIEAITTYLFKLKAQQ